MDFDAAENEGIETEPETTMDMEQRLEGLSDEVMALRFAFMTLARALHQERLLPIPALIERLDAVAEQMAAPDTGNLGSSSLSETSAQLRSLSVDLGQLQ